MAIIQNQKNGTIVIRATATGNVALSAASVNAATENVQSMSIRQIFFASDGSWTVARGANTVAVLPGYGHWNLAGHGVSLNEFANGSLDYTLSGNGTIVLVCQKTSIPV